MTLPPSPLLAAFLASQKDEVLSRWQVALTQEKLLDSVTATSDPRFHAENVVTPVEAFLIYLRTGETAKIYETIDTNIALRNLEQFALRSIIERLILLRRVVRETITAHGGFRRARLLAELGVMFDPLLIEITTHYEALQRLQTKELSHYYESILENSLAGIIVTDAQGQIQTCNPAMAKIAGCAREEIVGRTLHKDFARGADEELREAHARALEGESTTFEQKRYMNTRTGEQYLDFLISPRRDRHGNVVGTLHIVVDVTEKANLARTVQERQEEIRGRLDELQEAYGYIGRINRQLSSLIEIGDILASAQSLQAILDFVVRSAATVTKAAAATLRVVLPTERGEVYDASYADETRWSGRAPKPGTAPPRQYEHGVVRRIFFYDVTRVTPSLHPENARMFERLGQRTPPIVQVVIVPIAFQGDELGALSLFFHDSKEFTTLESNLLIAMTNQAALAAHASALATGQTIPVSVSEQQQS